MNNLLSQLAQQASDKASQAGSQTKATVGFWANWWNSHGDQLFAASVKIAVIIIVYLVIRLLAFHVMGRLLRLTVKNETANVREARVRALHAVLKSAVGFVLGFVMAIMVLQSAGLNIVPLLTTASVAGLAIGFGAQKLVKDVISGFFILVEDQYGVGDYVTIGPATGIVDDLGMRTTRVRDASGKLFIIANGDINQVYNHSRGALRVWTDVPLAASADLEKAKSVLDALGRKIAEEMPNKIETPFKYDGLAQLGADKVTIRFAGGVVAKYQDEVLLALNERIRSEFEANGLSLA